ncbi:uncharacterized protein MYCGRDRAFT_94844 [Zymoseptoria tritici IPO323]|uniref:Uncharacterized protein n=1 Tax=Zymoseptoria tritici (strain CBS 115943 / IPO323) TaxID=336722 RepID=F9XFH1_ZYMTI|nr:uncharacterized protein MYCGRDRAFT_94844 [Zymoseptoria tritici IPO323]EGP85930.1 hypothetical protein MYCGRDRAFT_94844 [Zymoseptoria tritici IPO323]
MDTAHTYGTRGKLNFGMGSNDSSKKESRKSPPPPSKGSKKTRMGKRARCTDQGTAAPAAAAAATTSTGGTALPAAPTQAVNPAAQPTTEAITPVDRRAGGLQYAPADTSNQALMSLPIRDSGSLQGRATQVPVKVQGTGEEDSSEQESEEDDVEQEEQDDSE